MFTEFYDKTPDLINEEELQEYFFHRKNVNKWSPNTIHLRNDHVQESNGGGCYPSLFLL